MKNFIEAEHLDQLDNVVFLDVRFDFTDPEAGRKQYEAGHIHGAFYLDLNEDLSSRPTGESGNHPMPDPGELTSRLEALGISNDTLVVAYDDGSNSVAGRAWFVLKHLGLDHVKVLNGGFAAALQAGLAITREIPDLPRSGLVEIRPDDSLLASYEEVLAHSREPKKNTVLLDSRAQARYEGREEHLYDVAGHIPGAENLVYSSPYDEDGRLLSGPELTQLFSRFRGKEDIILSCGSGVSAAANFLAMDEAGLKPRLYVGSYSQWLQKGNEVE